MATEECTAYMCHTYKSGSRVTIEERNAKQYMASEIDEDDRLSRQTTAFGECCLPSKSKSNVTPTKSLVRFQNQRFRVHTSRNDLPATFHDNYSSTSSVEPLCYTNSREESDRKYKAISKMTPGKEVKVFSSPKHVVSDCWKSTSEEIPRELVELFKENERNDEQTGGRIRKTKLSPEEDLTGPPLEKLSHTQEFHVLTEVQKARILTAVEDAIKKLANSDFKEYCTEEPPRLPESRSLHTEDVNIEKYFCKKFLLPWVIMKVMEMVVCHVIQLTFLSSDSYFVKKLEFLPVVVTYYFTLFIIIASLVIHIICYSYGGIHHPCYFMCLISSSILTLTTALGVLIMLCSMKYYKSFREILVLVFIGALLCSLVAELCFSYLELKNFWNRVQTAEQYYIS